ncbi:hypothetical protein C5167_021404 [Papaver somniferum]|nr:hypothetical protein C5167_021403 [Papaver somniferum]RZC91119.1 hypothetical protein C5167_021404 [Papaver somniferum]
MGLQKEWCEAVCQILPEIVALR